MKTLIKLSLIAVLATAMQNVNAQNKKDNKTDSKRVQKKLSDLSRHTITSDNFTQYKDEINKKSVAVNYSTSLYYLARSESDSLTRSH